MEQAKDGRVLFEIAEVAELVHREAMRRGIVSPGLWQFFVEFGMIATTDMVRDGRGQQFLAPTSRVLLTRMGVEPVPPGQTPTGIVMKQAQPAPPPAIVRKHHGKKGLVRHG